VVALASLIVAPWPMPTTEQLAGLGLIGLFGAAGQLTMSYSYHYAEASLVAPLDYVTLLFAVAIGYYVFGEIPHMSIWVGAPLVIAAGGIILWREYATLKRVRSASRFEP
ncbi:MAG: EamA family transporter, partial [Gammaproteobacteria bacterium]|nr:EamA family transporter [Gammaproteobacteria bacterium]